MLPWSAKARALIEEQYAPVGAAAMCGLGAAIGVLAAARARGVATGDVEDRFEARRDAAVQYDAAWRRYSWNVGRVDDLKLAPFHLLATESAVHDDQGHAWHMHTLGEICARDSGVLLATAWREVALADAAAVADAVAWWTALTDAGGEGVVVKPASFVARAGPRTAGAEGSRPRISPADLRP